MTVTSENRTETNHGPPEHASAREALSRVLASETFSRSQQQSRLLSYLCDRYFLGTSGELKEYTIATEVMGLADDYDQTEGSTVRVAIHRLRKRLKSYYEGEGSSEQLEIHLRLGEYTPEFLHRGSAREEDFGVQHAPFTQVEGELASATVAEDTGLPAVKGNETLPVDAGGGEELALPSASAPLSTRPRRTSSRWVTGAAIVLVVLATASWFRAKKLTGRPSPAKPLQHALLPASPANPLAGRGAPVRILAGSKTVQYTDPGGNLWIGDRYYQGGEERDITSAEANTKVPWVRREGDQTLVRHYRMGSFFSYAIPVQPGLYDLVLGFVETEFGPDQPRGGGENSRTFSIEVNGEDAASRLDVYAEAGGAYVLDARRFAGVMPAADGKVHLQFNTNSSFPAILSFIQLVPQMGDRANPVRIGTRDQAFIDNQGEKWIADNYYLGGQKIPLNSLPAQTSIPELYKTQRYGSFSYSIPVPRNHSYRVTLHFSESYFGIQDDDKLGRGAGARIFDVVCNGVILLNEFDILKEAGTKNTPVMKTFTGLKASPHGQLVLSFVPSRNYALVNAIEVLDEGPSR